MAFREATICVHAETKGPVHEIHVRGGLPSWLPAPASLAAWFCPEGCLEGQPEGHPV